MPKLDPDPFPPWSSSSERNISGGHRCQLSPSIFFLMCWWTRTRGTSKTRKSGSKHSDLTEESLNEFNRRNGAYCEGLTNASLYFNKSSRWSYGIVDNSNSMTLSPLKIQERCSCFEAKRTSNAAALAMMKPASCRPSTKVTSITDNKKEDVCVAEAEKLSTEKPSINRISAAARRSCQLVDMEEKRKEKKQEFNWVNKYQPKSLKDFICHREKAEMLHGLVSKGHFSHYILEGPPGVGKRTMVKAILRACFGPVKLEPKEECKEFKLEGGSISSIQINVRVSSQHIEVNASDLREYGTHVVMELMKETHSNLLNQKNPQLHHTNRQAIVLYEAEKLSMDAQLCIRSLLESHSSHNQVILCSSDISKLQHVRPLCMVIQLLPPSIMEIVEVLEFIAKQEGIELPCQLAKNIAENSKHSLQQAIRSFEATWQLNYPFNKNQVIMTGWEEELAKIAKDVIKEQSLKQLYNIREKLLLLQTYNISPEFIFKTLVGELKKHLNDELQSKISALFEEYNANNEGSFDCENLSFGNKKLRKRIDEPERKNFQLFMRIEEFIARFMSVYKVFSTGRVEEDRIYV